MLYKYPIKCYDGIAFALCMIVVEEGQSVILHIRRVFMSRSELFSLLRKEGIAPDTVAFDSNISPGYNIRKISSCRDAFYRIHGREYDCIGFRSESDALQFMYGMLVAYNEQLLSHKLSTRCG